MNSVIIGRLRGCTVYRQTPLDGQSIGVVGLRSGRDHLTPGPGPVSGRRYAQASCVLPGTNALQLFGADQLRPCYGVAGAPAARLQAPSVIRDRRSIKQGFGFPCASRDGSTGISPSELVGRKAAALEERARENWLCLIRTGYRAFSSLSAAMNVPRLGFTCFIGVKCLSSPWGAEPWSPLILVREMCGSKFPEASPTYGHR